MVASHSHVPAIDRSSNTNSKIHSKTTKLSPLYTVAVIAFAVALLIAALPQLINFKRFATSRASIMSDSHSHHHHHGHNHQHSHDDPSSARSCAESHAASAVASQPHAEDFTETNRAHWNKVAKDYTKEDWQKDIVAKVTKFLQANVEFLGLPSDSNAGKRNPPVRVLDYACGPGTVTYALGKHADEYVGLDLSDGMIEEYNSRANTEQGFVAKATQANLLSKDEAVVQRMKGLYSGAEYRDFDLAIVGLGFHHFEDLSNATRVLTERLKPGGTLAIVEFGSHEMEIETDDIKKIVAHAGFGFGTVKKLFEEDGGLVDVDWVVMDGEISLGGKGSRKVFLARGRKPVTEKL